MVVSFLYEFLKIRINFQMVEMGRLELPSKNTSQEISTSLVSYTFSKLIKVTDNLLICNTINFHYYL